MLLDHIGLMFFPETEFFRILGRLALPIYAYMIAEGCRYTKNRLRYWLTIFALGAACQVVYYVALQDTYMCILITFSLSIPGVYALDHVKRCLFLPCPAPRAVGALCLLALTLTAILALNRYLEIDYGFWGIMLPVLVSIPHRVGTMSGRWEKLDCTPVRVLLLSIGLVMLSIRAGGVQPYAFLAIPLLLCYSGKRGTWNLKYFFYAFYPAHFVLLQLISMAVG